MDQQKTTTTDLAKRLKTVEAKVNWLPVRVQPSGTSIQVGNRDVGSSITPPSHTSMTASADSSSALNSGHRVVETGVIFPFIKHSFVCCFQSEPFWLLALDPSFTSRIYVDNSISSFTDFHFYLSTYNRLNLFNKVVSRLGRSKFIFDFRLDSLFVTP